MAISVLTRLPENFGSQSGAVGTVQLDASYPTGGYSLTPEMFQLSQVNSFLVTTDDASLLFYNYTTEKLMAFTAAGGAGGNTGATSGGTPAGTNGTSAVTGTGAGDVVPLGTNGTSAVSGTGTFVGTSAGALDLATPAFSGTGFSTAGQDVTTTDNQTMGLNECAGMWLIADGLASTAPVLIVSNTAVALAPAVFTVIGTAPATDAGTYRVVKNIIPTGSVTALSGTAAAQTFTGASSVVTVSSLSGTAAAQTFTGALLGTHVHTVAAGGGGLSEVSNGTDLSTVIGNYIVIGQ